MKATDVSLQGFLTLLSLRLHSLLQIPMHQELVSIPKEKLDVTGSRDAVYLCFRAVHLLSSFCLLL